MPPNSHRCISSDLPSEVINLKQANQQAYFAQKRRVAFVSFPRSGSNWACAILTAILQQAMEKGQAVKLTGRTGCGIFPLDSPNKNYAHWLSMPHCSGIVKTHSHFWDEGSHIMYMFRDARETLASFRHWHRKKFPDREFNSWSDWRYVRFFLPQLVKSWCKAAYFGIRHPENIVFVDYRDLLHAPENPLRNLARFLGGTMSYPDLATIYQSQALGSMRSSKPALIYRGAQANKGNGDFSKPLLVFIALIAWLPLSILRVLAGRSVRVAAR